MAKVDDVLEERIGMASDDLPDLCYRDLFDQGFTADEAAQAAVSNANGS
jgi:hypothetical protein